MKRTLTLILIILGIIAVGFYVKHEIEREIMQQKVMQEYEEAKRIITEEIEIAKENMKR